MNYFELYPGDYLRDTTELSLADHGAYIKLMMTYYSKEEALPAELPRLYQIATAITAAEKASVRKVVEMFFPVAADGLRHKNRIDEEIAKAQKRIQASKENGKKGASSHPKNTPKTNPQQPPQQGVCQGGQQTPCSGEALHAPPNQDQKLPATPGAADAKPADPIFGIGLEFLIRKGVPERNARSFLGLLRKELDDLTVASLLREAEDQDITDPQSWLTAAAKSKKTGGKNANRPAGGKLSAVEQVQQAIADRDARIIEGSFAFDDPR